MHMWTTGKNKIDAESRSCILYFFIYIYKFLAHFSRAEVFLQILGYFHNKHDVDGKMKHEWKN